MHGYLATWLAVLHGILSYKRTSRQRPASNTNILCTLYCTRVERQKNYPFSTSALAENKSRLLYPSDSRIAIATSNIPCLRLPHSLFLCDKYCTTMDPHQNAEPGLCTYFAEELLGVVRAADLSKLTWLRGTLCGRTYTLPSSIART